MKRGVLVICVFLILILSVSLVSASWFSDFWGKITGRATTDITKICTDTDTGIEPMSPGWVNKSRKIYFDNCLDNNTLVEYYCSKNKVSHKNFRCPEGCYAKPSAGAICIKCADLCKDGTSFCSDNKNILVCGNYDDNICTETKEEICLGKCSDNKNRAKCKCNKSVKELCKNDGSVYGDVRLQSDSNIIIKDKPNTIEFVPIDYALNDLRDLTSKLVIADEKKNVFFYNLSNYSASEKDGKISYFNFEYFIDNLSNISPDSKKIYLWFIFYGIDDETGLRKVFVSEGARTSSINLFILDTTKTSCRKLVDNGVDSEKINIFFVTDNCKDISEDNIYEHINGSLGLFSVFPLNENEDKFNIYSVCTDYTFDCFTPLDPENRLPCNKYFAELLINEACPDTYKYDQIGIASTLSGRRYASMGGGFFTTEQYSYSGTWSVYTTVHEFGHSFGSLGDEYIEDPPSPRKDFSFTPDLINIDNEGCSKWCSGLLNEDSACYQVYSKWKDCILSSTKDNEEYCTSTAFEEYSQLTNGGWWGDCEIGTECRSDIGCFNGAQYAYGFWRPIMNGIMRMFYQTDYRYGTISEEQLQRIIDNNGVLPTTGAETPSSKLPVIFFDEIIEGNLSGGSLDFNKISLAETAEIITKAKFKEGKIRVEEKEKIKREFSTEYRAASRARRKALIEENIKEISIPSLVESYLEVKNK